MPLQSPALSAPALVCPLLVDVFGFCPVERLSALAPARQGHPTLAETFLRPVLKKHTGGLELKDFFYQCAFTHMELFICI